MLFLVLLYFYVGTNVFPFIVKVDGISLRIFATLFSARDHSADPYLSFTAKMYVPELGVADE